MVLQEVITADVVHFDTKKRFDRVVSIEMFEHMKNYQVHSEGLFSRVGLCRAFRLPSFVRSHIPVVSCIAILSEPGTSAGSIAQHRIVDETRGAPVRPHLHPQEPGLPL